MSYRCPSCGHKDAWEGVVQIHCPNFRCQHFDEKLLDKILEEDAAERERSWEDKTDPYPIGYSPYVRFASTATNDLAESESHKWTYTNYGLFNYFIYAPAWEEAYNRLYRELAEGFIRTGKKC